MKAIQRFVEVVGRVIANVVVTIINVCKDGVQVCLNTIVPFVVFVAIMTTLINKTGAGNAFANAMLPLAGNVIGLVVIAIVCCIPFLSPLLAPGAVPAAVIGSLIGTQIAAGKIAPAMALPALWAVDGQVGMDTMPLGYSLLGAEAETLENGMPAELFSRFITGPLAVVVAWLFSFGM
jgi:sorbitol-specific phosphotransferase system component IIBC